MTVVRPNSEGLSVLDKPNSYIGKTVPRPNLDRLMQGRGLYVSDMELPRMAHVMFLRSPHAHAKIAGIDPSAARQIRCRRRAIRHATRRVAGWWR